MRKALSLFLFLVIPAAAQRPPIRHVFTIVLENKSFDETFGPNSSAPYLSKQLTAQGELLTNYYAIGHNSLPNYIALVSGQAPNAITQSVLNGIGRRSQQISQLISETGHQPASGVGGQFVEVHGNDAPRALHADLHEKCA